MFFVCFLTLVALLFPYATLSYLILGNSALNTFSFLFHFLYNLDQVFGNGLGEENQHFLVCSVITWKALGNNMYYHLLPTAPLLGQ